MKSILNQLKKYQSEQPSKQVVVSEDIVDGFYDYNKILESICDITDFEWRKQVINDCLLALSGFQPSKSVGKLYPVELDVLYYLYYHKRIVVCGEKQAELIFERFLSCALDIDLYMKVLIDSLDDGSMAVFLARVALAAFNRAGTSKRDSIEREYGVKAAKVLGIEPNAQSALLKLDSLAALSQEQLILGRITYIAFWEWSRSRFSQQALLLLEHK